jgi:Fucose permease
MATFFLLIIYASFISLGLPDSLLGVAWPLMYAEYRVPFGFAGFISITVSVGTIFSSLFSGVVIRRFGTGKVTFVSVLMTAAALLGYSFAPSVYWLLILAIPLGLGAGAVDCGLNEYVAEHYQSLQMNWLHCFWGVGAMTGPIIMSRFIDSHSSWRNGYFTVSIIQFCLVALLFATLPLWGKMERLRKADNPEESEASESEAKAEPLPAPKLIKKRGVIFSLLTFVFYCGVEQTMGLWGSSFLVKGRGVDAALAAAWVSAFYGGITAGRFLSGIVTLKVNNRNMIRIGEAILLSGILLLLLPLPTMFCFFGFLLVGLGCAPIFPCMLHETPARFGKEDAQGIMGFQMASSYLGTTLLPPAFGWIASNIHAGFLPVFLIAYAAVLIFCTEKLNRLTKGKHAGLPSAA